MLVPPPVFKTGVGRESGLGGFDSRAPPPITRIDPSAMVDPKSPDARLRSLPAVGALLARPGIADLVLEHGHAAVVRGIREAVAEARRVLQEGGEARVSDEDVRARVACRGADRCAR